MNDVIRMILIIKILEEKIPVYIYENSLVWSGRRNP
jgi:hypothetical protein